MCQNRRLSASVAILSAFVPKSMLECSTMMSNRKQPAKTPFDKFADAAKSIFNLPKRAVSKIKAKTPRPRRGKRNGT